MTIDRWITDAAARWPRKPALVFADETLDYAQMSQRIAAMAAELAGLGVGRGDRVAWYGTNHPQVFVLLFACARIGAILVPVNWRLAAAEIAAIVANCAPRVLFHDSHFAAEARAIPGPLIVAHDAALTATPGDLPPPPDDHSPLLLVYTSGSTGRPKGVLLTQKALICNAKMSVYAHRMRTDDTVLNVLPLFHVGGLNILPTPAFSIGATVHLQERFVPAAALAALQRVNLAIVVPTVLQALMAEPGWQDANLGRLRALSIGSTDVPVSLIEAVHSRGLPVIQVYGATETAPFAICQRIDEAMSSVGSIGRACPGCAVRLVGDDGRDVTPGERGEIWVRGDNVLVRYWNDPAETSRALRDGWFLTGDVAHRDRDGNYWFDDRIKHLIISGGENIYPAEIERALRDHPAVAEVAVVGRADPKWGEVPVAVVVRAGPIDADGILAGLRGRIARYKRPRDVVFVEALPRNAMGKVVAADVRAMIAGPKDNTCSRDRPRG